MGKSLAQLDFWRRALLARLDHGDVEESEAYALMRQLEDLDLTMAAAPANDVAELLLKIERLVEAIALETDGEEASLESVLLSAVLKDARCLAASAN